MEDCKSSSHTDKKPIGQILIEAGLISIAQLELALQEQKQNNIRIGEILVAHDWILPKTINFFCDRWLELIKTKPKQPIASYFQEAGLLSVEQCEAIIRLQKFKREKVRFHRLAIEQGYLKQSTVDFFLAYLFKVYDPKTISSAKPYELLKNYSEGQTDFSRVDLSKAPLMSVTLKGISLNGSNLRKADLSKANLSNAKLIQVNLSLANLSQAVLTKANFTRAFLTRTNLREAHLERANFQSAILHEADFRSAYLAKANFSGADLTKAILPLDYPYRIYYDRYTVFDRALDSRYNGGNLRNALSRDFEPQTMGWTEISKN